MVRFGREQPSSHGHWLLLTIDLVLCYSNQKPRTWALPSAGNNWTHHDQYCSLSGSEWCHKKGLWSTGHFAIGTGWLVIELVTAPQGEADFCVIGLVFRAKAGNGLYPFSQLSSVLVAQRKSKEWVFADATVLCHLLSVDMVNPQGSSISRPMVSPWARSLLSCLQTNSRNTEKCSCSEHWRERD